MTLQGNLCRICLKRNGLLHMYEPNSSDMLSGMLTACSSVKLEKDDGLPPYICIYCTRDLEKSFHFKIQCEKSDMILKQTYVLNSHTPLTADETTFMDETDIKTSLKEDCDDDSIGYGDIKYETKDYSDPSDLVQVEFKNKISFEEPSELIEKIADHVLHSSNTHNERQQTDFVEAQKYLKTKKSLTIKKLVKEEEDDEEYKPREKKIKDNIRIRKVKRIMKNTENYKSCSSGSSKPKKMMEGPTRIKGNPTIITLSKYKNVTKGAKYTGPRKHGGMIKVYKSDKNKSMKDSRTPGKRGRKPFLTRDEHGKIVRPKHQCYVCGLMTADIKQHMTSHSGEKQHNCDVCSRRFSTRGNLIHHMKIHSGVKSHVCQVCGASFIYGSCLQRHLDIHTGTKPHKCHLCDKAFQLAQGLRRHLSVHEGARPHACHMCPARFNQPHQLKTHIRSHTGEKPYVCNECGEAFTYKYVLNNHVKKHAAAAAAVAAVSMPQHNINVIVGPPLTHSQNNMSMGSTICSQ